MDYESKDPYTPGKPGPLLQVLGEHESLIQVNMDHCTPGTRRIWILTSERKKFTLSTDHAACKCKLLKEIKLQFSFLETLFDL